MSGTRFIGLGKADIKVALNVIYLMVSILSLFAFSLFLKLFFGIENKYIYFFLGICLYTPFYFYYTKLFHRHSAKIKAWTTLGTFVSIFIFASLAYLVATM